MRTVTVLGGVTSGPTGQVKTPGPPMEDRSKHDASTVASTRPPLASATILMLGTTNDARSTMVTGKPVRFIVRPGAASAPSNTSLASNERRVPERIELVTVPPPEPGCQDVKVPPSTAGRHPRPVTVKNTGLGSGLATTVVVVDVVVVDVDGVVRGGVVSNVADAIRVLGTPA
jgi:hypothetical protein